MKVAWILLAALAPTPLAFSGDTPIDFAGLGQKLFAAGDAKRAASEAAPDEPGIDDRFLHRLLPLHHRLRLGAVEIWIPKESLRAPGERGQGTALPTMVNFASLALKLERSWIDRLALDDKSRDGAKKSLTALEAWVRSWKDGHIAEVKPEIETALAQVAGIFSDPPAAAGATPSGAASEPAKRFPHAPVLLVGVTRTDFVSLLGAAGVIESTYQSRLWLPAVRTWLSAGLFVRVSAVGLSYGPQGEDGPAFVDNPMSLGDASPQVVHQVSHLLVGQLLPEAPTWLQEGLALADTVEITKSDETRCTGSAEGNEIGAKSGFQAGQIQDFRIIPGMPAELSPFRRGPSSTFFVKELHRTRTPDGFKIIDFKTGKAVTIAGPFLLPQEKMPAKVTSGEDGLKSGYAEFFRAYVGAFAHFLNEQKVDKKPLLSALVHELREQRAQSPPSETRFHDAVQKVTSRSLGAGTDPKKDWEAAYVAWLEKG